MLAALLGQLFQMLFQILVNSYEPGGIDDLVIIMDLVMNMGAGTSAAVADQPDDLAPGNLVTFADQALLQMGKLGPEAVAMVNHNEMTVALVVPLPQDYPVCSGLYIRTPLPPDIQTPVVSAFAVNRVGTPTEP